MSEVDSKVEQIKLLIIPGSLRSASSTHKVVDYIVSILPSNVKALVYNGLGMLPHFDDNPQPHDTVLEFREAIKLADGVIICTPEYAFGVPGSLKNALDWTVSSGDFVHKPVSLITAATGGENAHRSLMLTLTAISCYLPPQAQLLISFIRSKLNDTGEVTDVQTAKSLQKVVATLIEAILDTEKVEDN